MSTGFLIIGIICIVVGITKYPAGMVVILLRLLEIL